MGNWLRYLSAATGTFWPVVLGQVISQCGVPFLLNGCGIVAVVWFGENERNKATTIAGLANICGSILGLAIAGESCSSFGSLTDKTAANPVYVELVKEAVY